MNEDIICLVETLTDTVLDVEIILAKLFIFTKKSGKPRKFTIIV